MIRAPQDYTLALGLLARLVTDEDEGYVALLSDRIILDCSLALTPEERELVGRLWGVE